MRVINKFALLCLSLSLSACSIQSSQPNVKLPREGSWVMLPLVNYSQAPQAGERAEQILYTLLAKQGLSAAPYSATDNQEALLLDDSERLQQALLWAKQRGANYAVSGSVDEWQYKSGLDGEPAVGITLKVIEPSSGRILWSGSAARAGWSRESLAGAGQRVLDSLVNDLPIDRIDE